MPLVDLSNLYLQGLDALSGPVSVTLPYLTTHGPWAPGKN